MGYEVDFLGVGEESKSGDAIALRFGNLTGDRHEQTVVIIDGGFKDTGLKLVDHVSNHFGTKVVDLVINTHPDQDHINGLQTVLEELEVKEFWIHKPWEHNEGLSDKFKDGRVTDNSLSDKLKSNLESAWELIKLAESKGIPVSEPFTGSMDSTGSLKVLGPSLDYYESLIPEFDGMPETTDSDESKSATFLEKAVGAVLRFFATWGEDQIDDEGVTSAKNNSSVITQIIVDDRRLIFTGDSGIQALGFAADEVDACTSSAELKLMQIPHHGSKRNIGKTVLNRLIGKPVAQGESRGINAIASTARKGEPKHPRKAVMNAFTHRGVTALATRGKGIRYSHEAPDRDGWTPLDPEPYHFDYEEEEA